MPVRSAGGVSGTRSAKERIPKDGVALADDVSSRMIILIANLLAGGNSYASDAQSPACDARAHAACGPRITCTASYARATAADSWHVQAW